MKNASKLFWHLPSILLMYGTGYSLSAYASPPAFSIQFWFFRNVIFEKPFFFHFRKSYIDRWMNQYFPLAQSALMMICESKFATFSIIYVLSFYIFWYGIECYFLLWKIRLVIQLPGYNHYFQFKYHFMVKFWNFNVKGNFFNSNVTFR